MFYAPNETKYIYSYGISFIVQLPTPGPPPLTHFSVHWY